MQEAIYVSADILSDKENDYHDYQWKKKIYIQRQKVLCSR